MVPESDCNIYSLPVTSVVFSRHRFCLFISRVHSRCRKKHSIFLPFVSIITQLSYAGDTMTLMRSSTRVSIDVQSCLHKLPLLLIQCKLEDFSPKHFVLYCGLLFRHKLCISKENRSFYSLRRDYVPSLSLNSDSLTSYRLQPLPYIRIVSVPEARTIR